MRLRLVVAFLLILFASPVFMVFSGTVHLGHDWRAVRWDSAGLAPDPAKTLEAVVQVYAARAFSWRGLFGVHTWIATKPAHAPHFTVHQVIGWRLFHGLAVVSSRPDIPDRYWGGNPPEILADLRDSEAADAIGKIMDAMEAYPYTHAYHLWPGPNSNTFTAYVARRVPELRLSLPVTAMGKDYPIHSGLVDRAPSGTGYQLSIYGLAGLLIAKREGIELNLLGLSFGVDPVRPALKLPFIGRLGFHAKLTVSRPSAPSPRPLQPLPQYSVFVPHPPGPLVGD
ncbi:MAG: DUF3750 domain-containing protein [Candidatus Methylomirabilales bacterium]